MKNRKAIVGTALLVLGLCASSAEAKPAPHHAPVRAATIKSTAKLATPVLPTALTVDPPRDPDHPTENIALRLQSHGSLMNAVMFAASGAQPHPTVLLLHGLPGNEQNLDLAQALRRAGYNVLTVHYRGSWGSGGTFSLSHAVEDGQAALDFLFDPANLAIYHIDPARITVIGHSLGGFVAVRAAASNPRVAAIGLIAPWDIGEDAATFNVPPAALPGAAAKFFDDVDGRLGTVTSLDLAREIAADGSDWHMASSAGAVAGRPILVITAQHDDPDDTGAELMQALAGGHAPGVRTISLNSDHAFSDHRIALEAEILNWLKGIGY